MIKLNEVNTKTGTFEEIYVGADSIIWMKEHTTTDMNDYQSNYTEIGLADAAVFNVVETPKRIFAILKEDKENHKPTIQRNPYNFSNRY